MLQHTNIEVAGTLPTETTPQEMRQMALRHPDVTFLWGHAGSDLEFGVKCALGLNNVLMDIGGNEATNGYTEMLVRYLGAERVVSMGATRRADPSRRNWQRSTAPTSQKTSATRFFTGMPRHSLPGRGIMRAQRDVSST